MNTIQIVSMIIALAAPVMYLIYKLVTRKKKPRKNHSKKVIANALWVIVKNGKVLKVVNERGEEQMLYTVKGSRRLYISKDSDHLNQLSLSIVVNIAGSVEEVIEKMKQFK
jgi:hypothetical protein